MIRVPPVPEPEKFDEEARKPGRQWLEDNPSTTRPRDYWSPFKPQLAAGFRHLCAYSALYEPVGTTDHFLSLRKHRHLAYEWTNYRFASAWLNSAKMNADEEILDPYQVEDGWFEILLPSLQLVVTRLVPEEFRAKAEYTLERLHLRDDERVIRQRQEWYRMYLSGELTLDGLRKKAPLIARAVEQRSGPGFERQPVR